MDDESDEPRPPKRDQLSRTPSWIMLGFALGVACVLAWPHAKEPAAPPRIERAPAAAPAPEPPTVERAIFFEDVFNHFSRFAVWQDDVTEVAFWNDAQRAFSDCYEVLRVGDKFYFRSIPHLTRSVFTPKDVLPDSPLQFTLPAGMSVEQAPAFSLIRRGDPPPAPFAASAEPVPAAAPPMLSAAKPPIDLPKKK